MLQHRRDQTGSRDDLVQTLARQSATFLGHSQTHEQIASEYCHFRTPAHCCAAETSYPDPPSQRSPDEVLYGLTSLDSDPDILCADRKVTQPSRTVESLTAAVLSVKSHPGCSENHSAFRFPTDRIVRALQQTERRDARRNAEAIAKEENKTDSQTGRNGRSERSENRAKEARRGAKSATASCRCLPSFPDTDQSLAAPFAAYTAACRAFRQAPFHHPRDRDHRAEDVASPYRAE